MEFLLPYQSFFIREAYFLTSTPFVPRGLSSLMSSKNLFERKYSVRLMVLDRHYNPEFMKQVLPKFWRPHTPITDEFVYTSSFIVSSSDADFSHLAL